MNYLKLNSTKTNCMRISLKQTNPYIYKITGKSIDHTVIQKHIGIFYDSKMSFNLHVNYIVEKANKRYYTIRFLSKRLNGSTLLKLYKTYILPILEYSNLCLSYNKTQAQQLESVQRMITRDICFRYNRAGLTYVERLKFLDIKSLENRRKIQTLKFIFKDIHEFPEITGNLLNQIVIMNDVRNGRSILRGDRRIELSNKYIIEFAVRLFNELPMNIRCETNFSKFKSLIKNL